MMETLPEISLGTAVLIIFGVCAGYMFFRGVARTFLNTAFLLISAWVGFRIWQESPALSIEWFGKSSQVIIVGLTIIAAIGTLIILKKLYKTLFKTPMSDSTAQDSDGQSKSLFFRLILISIPALLICFTIGVFLHHGSSVAEVKNSAKFGINSDKSFAERIKNSISSVFPEFLMNTLDPLTTQPRLQLAKIIAENQREAPESLIDPDTGKPYPRAVIVNNPELVSLVKNGDFSSLLRHPLLTKALQDPDIRKDIGLD